MSETPNSLEQQLTHRIREWLSNTGISQRQLAKMIKVDPGNFNAFLGGYKSLSQQKMGKLLQYLNLNRFQLEAKFNPARSTQITHFQQQGQPMRLANDGWYPGAGGSGVGIDPNDSGDDIATVRSTGAEGDDPSYDDLTRILAQVQALHRQAIQTITDYETRQKAKPNPNGSTGPARQISRPKTPGPRGDMLP
jgi:transcriptional regulator with XRE-family HTH domain